MLFCSVNFLIFFSVVFAAYWAMPWQRPRVYLLLGASIYFYASWNHWLALIICASTTFDYFVARAMDTSPSERRRKILLTLTIVANLSLLCYFKYANFFLESLEAALNAAGAQASLPLLSVILPIGISFYTFEAINYGVDVYRRHTPAEKSLPNFMLFILFFPHLIAGPIVRAKDFLPQIHRPKQWNWLRAQVGIEYFLRGMVKKMFVADWMARFADPIFADPDSFRSGAAWVAVIAYSFQIYCDFSGYTDMALGCAHLLGYKLAQNFNMPYLAVNISDFWRRWHISLSTWLRDYLFIPLGGSRGTEFQTCRNLMITMALGGLWHGASWNFVVWGLVLGALLCGHRQFRAFAKARPKLDAILVSRPGTVVRVGVTFLTIALTWVLFRSTSFADAAQIYTRLFVPFDGLRWTLPRQALLFIVFLVAIASLMTHSGWTKRIWRKAPAPVLGFAYAVLLAFVLVFNPGGGETFIYFQF